MISKDLQSHIIAFQLSISHTMPTSRDFTYYFSIFHVINFTSLHEWISTSTPTLPPLSFNSKINYVKSITTLSSGTAHLWPLNLLHYRNSSSFVFYHHLTTLIVFERTVNFFLPKKLKCTHQINSVYQFMELVGG